MKYEIIKYIYINEIMKVKCPRDYHLTDFVATHAFANKLYSYTLLLVPTN